jgi:molecular chaperone GrpE
MSNKKTEPSLDDKIDDVIESVEQAAIDAAAAGDEERLASLTQEELIIEYEQQHQRANEFHDKYLRLQAEMDNMRRRTERDISAAHKYGSEKLIKDLLPVVDSLERGLEVQASTPEVKAMHEGMEMTLKLLLETLEKNGVKAIEPEGQPFNPDEMQAISMQPADNVDPNTVLNVVQKGYSLNGRLLKPALVVVSQ